MMFKPRKTMKANPAKELYYLIEEWHDDEERFVLNGQCQQIRTRIRIFDNRSELIEAFQKADTCYNVRVIIGHELQLEYKTKKTVIARSGEGPKVKGGNIVFEERI